MALPFFGLRPIDRAALHNQLFELVYFGKFSYNDVYHMPVYIKTFFYNKLIETKRIEKEQRSGNTNMVTDKVQRKPPTKRK